MRLDIWKMSRKNLFRNDKSNFLVYCEVPNCVHFRFHCTEVHWIKKYV